MVRGMRKCAKCGREYDDPMRFCLDDGSALLYGPASLSSESPVTAILPDPTTSAGRQPASEDSRSSFDHTTVADAGPREIFGELSGGQNSSTGPGSKAPDKVGGRRTQLAVAGIVALVLIGGFLGFRYFGQNNKQIESIAVMPFVNESGNAEVEYLSDGMTETLIKSLSQIPNLSVKPRSSVFRYKGKDTDLQTIANQLNVQAILNGRFTQRGDQVTLSLELIDVAKDSVIWNEICNRRQIDLVSLQSEIAKDVSTNLKSKLTNVDEAKVVKTSTANPEAYQLYLRGRYQWNQRTGESLKQAVDYFNKAIEKDPGYALAYSGLAESYTLFGPNDVEPPRQAMPKAMAAALRAIELDDSLAEPHVALGIYYSNFAWNQPAAEVEFRRAIELNPNYATAHQQLGIECLSAMGRFDEAVAEGRRAQELDPLSPIIGADLANILLRARRFDESIAELNRNLTLDGNFWVTYSLLGHAYYAKGQYKEAVAYYQKARELDDNPFLKAMLIRALSKTGEHEEAVKLFSELQHESKSHYVQRSALAIAYAALGEQDNAFALLEDDFAERSSRPPGFSVSPIWDDLRDDPRFAELIRRVEISKLE